MYTSRDAMSERQLADSLAQGEEISFAQLFPGQFFASDAQRADGSTITAFEQSKGVTFLPLSAVLLEKNARYIIVSNSPSTTFTARNLPVCGNAQIEGSEQCDDGAQNGDICDSVMGGSCQYCSTSCMILTVSPSTPVCGNGVRESSEQCDDGNTFSGDGCSAMCQTEQQGGQSHLSCVSNMCVSVAGPGPNGCASNADCSPPLQPVCGNEVTELGEECDDGNTQSGDGCSASCQTESMMVSWHNSTQPMDADNDGIVASDDVTAVIAYLNNIPPNTQAVNPYLTPTPRYPDVNNDGVVTPVDALIISNWIAEQCGNGQFVPDLGEECDVGNANNTDSCSNTCKRLVAPF
jgi:cysteine-rich repeat protein